MNKFDYANNVAESPVVISVLVTDTVVSAADENRLSETICNISSNNIHLGFGVAAELNKGIQLPPGSAITYGIATDIPWIGAVNAIAATGTSSLTKQVIKRVSGR